MKIKVAFLDGDKMDVNEHDYLNMVQNFLNYGKITIIVIIAYSLFR